MVVYTWYMGYKGYILMITMVVNHQNQHQGYQLATMEIFILWLFGIAKENDPFVNCLFTYLHIVIVHSHVN